MAVTVENVASYVNVNVAEPLLPALLEQAEVLIDEYLGYGGVSRCPQAVHDWALLQLASELWSRRNSPNGAAQWGPDGQVAYLSSDPLASVKPVLKRYRGIGAVG